jgi:hypothetical protein
VTDQTPINTENQIGRHLLSEFAKAAAYDMRTAVAAADAALEAFAPAYPECAPLYEGAMRDAEWWADCAFDAQLVAVLSACLKKVATQRIVSPNARKRALVAIWNSLSAADKAAFLEFVDPGSKGQG